MKKFLVLLMSVLLVTMTACTKKNNGNNEEEPEKPDEPAVVEEEKVSFDLISYEVYKPLSAAAKNLSFHIVIAKVRIRTEEKVNLSMDDIVTSEKISLGKVNAYIDEINKAGVTLKDFNLSEDLKSDSSSAVFTLFVPVSRYAEEVSLTLLEKYEVEIDLDKNVRDLALISAEEQTVIGNEEFVVEVVAVVRATGENLLVNGEVVGTSTSDIYAIRLEINPLSGKSVTVEAAEYVSADTSDSFEALSAEYETEKKENIIGTAVTAKSQGYLLFEVNNPEKQSLSYQGILIIKVNGEWYNIAVDL